MLSTVQPYNTSLFYGEAILVYYCIGRVPTFHFIRRVDFIFEKILLIRTSHHSIVARGTFFNITNPMIYIKNNIKHDLYNFSGNEHASIQPNKDNSYVISTET
jgi:hypothetical protein